MPERPILPIPDPLLLSRQPGKPPRERVKAPGRGRQIARLGPRFERLENALSDPSALEEYAADAHSIAPDRAVVFEVASTVRDFYMAARAIGLEILAEDEVDFPPDETFIELSSKGNERADRNYGGRVYFAMPDMTALNQLVSLWNQYKAEETLPHGFRSWTHIFEHLRDVRPWGAEDRIQDTSIAYWQDWMGEHPETPVRVEMELWFSANADRQRNVRDRVIGQLAGLDARVIAESTIEEIRYSAMLVEIPASSMDTILDRGDGFPSIAHDVIYVVPQSAASIGALEREETEVDAQLGADGVNGLEPIVALLDGLPVANHEALAGRLLIEDPDDLSARYGNVSEQLHGTAMASLILRGDLHRGEPALGRSIYVRPVMQGGGDDRAEHLPTDKLVVDLIYRAVKRMKEGEGDVQATAPSVRVVNLSLGDMNRPFSGLISPWARLIDMLSYRFNVLFVVSAGNIFGELQLPGMAKWSQLEDSEMGERTRVVLASVNQQRAQRSLLSPAEAMNALSVGAAHKDGMSNRRPGAMQVDPFDRSTLPNVSSGLGLGYRRSIKPDLLLDGGCESVTLSRAGESLYVQSPSGSGRAFGVRAATPGVAGELNRLTNTYGTSVSAALATRGAHRIIEALEDQAGGSHHHDVPPEFHALMAKALLVHASAWDLDSAVLLREVVDPDGNLPWMHCDDDVARFLGFGVCDVGRAIECTEKRATLLGHGIMHRDESYEYKVPLPPGLEGAKDFRAVTTTIAWFSPVTPSHRSYRDAQLKLETTDTKQVAGVKRERQKAPQPSDASTGRGTVIHDRRVGSKAVDFVDDGSLVFKLSCSSPTQALEQEDPIPFAVAASIEVGVDTNIQVYEQVKAAVEARVRIQTGAP